MNLSIAVYGDHNGICAYTFMYGQGVYTVSNLAVLTPSQYQLEMWIDRFNHYRHSRYTPQVSRVWINQSRFLAGILQKKRFTNLNQNVLLSENESQGVGDTLQDTYMVINSLLADGKLKTDDLAREPLERALSGYTHPDPDHIVSALFYGIALAHLERLLEPEMMQASYLV